MVSSGDSQNLATLLERVERIGLDGQEQFYRAGSGWGQAGRYAEAEKCFDRALSYPSLQYFYAAHAGRGSARIRLGRPEDGFADLKVAKAFDPDRPLAYLIQSEALALLGETEAALQETRNGLARSPGNDMLIRQQDILSRGLRGGPAPPRVQPLPPGK